MMDPSAITPALAHALMAQIAAGAPGAAELQRRYGAAIMHVLGQSQPPQPPPAAAPPQPADPAAEDARRQQLESDAVGVTSSEIFSSYTPSQEFPGCQPHPADVAEAASLAATPTPRVDYPIADGLPAEVLAEGKVSSLQVESVALACERHRALLPPAAPGAAATRAGFFIGDGAGVGKGRQLAAVVLDNLARGRAKHLWFSTSSDLRHDAQRDLRDLGCHVAVHDGAQELDRGTLGLGMAKGLREGVLFSTYATLVSAGAQKQKGKSRLQQLVDWCGGAAFDGALLFDECHKAKNYTGKEETSSKVSQAVLELQRLLPRARVVYCSATGASELSNMAYMERLALWGPSSAFKSFDDFVAAVTRRGVGGLEMLAMEMKSTGMYVTRDSSLPRATRHSPLTTRHHHPQVRLARPRVHRRRV